MEEDLQQDKKKSARSFTAARAQFKKDVIEDTAIIEDFTQRQIDKLQASTDKVADQQESKSFWGKLATIGTTLGCSVVSAITTGGTTIGACVAAGTAAGAIVRGGIDNLDKSENEIYNFDAGEIDTKYYNAKADEIADEINAEADIIGESLKQEWKSDVLAQLSDSMTAYSIASGVDKLGGFDSFEGMYQAPAVTPEAINPIDPFKLNTNTDFTLGVTPPDRASLSSIDLGGAATEKAEGIYLQQLVDKGNQLESDLLGMIKDTLLEDLPEGISDMEDVIPPRYTRFFTPDLLKNIPEYVSPLQKSAELLERLNIKQLPSINKEGI